ncbi:L-threonylcarbamoyladenylate synthase [Halovivax gelatinilyticus]|uniref:L-threonylcarbamoyladenylate synthase n=1 Tax=Halovivax gelatinilyticus TaxID=2961597 RepID=UPI0020CA8790|nr:L-threonylcarbamoyladenylate synthase [Halovivax gelatinilyticus]
MGELREAADAIAEGQLVVYPTETVYGLAADATDPAAIERVYDVKGRDRENPISMAVPSVPTALSHVRATDRERRFMATFLPGPVTVLCPRREHVPDVLTAGRDRVGVRIPDHRIALRLCELADRPITATSANESGEPSALRLADVDEPVREASAVLLDGGETGGIESTVVDVSTESIHRRGADADRIERWLAAN